jgi:hypothetical protein
MTAWICYREDQKNEVAFSVSVSFVTEQVSAD